MRCVWTAALRGALLGGFTLVPACGGATADAGGDGGAFTSPICTNPTPALIGGRDTGFVRCREQYQHRARVVDCPSVGARAPCADDAGRCADGCDRDGDCGAGQICECGDQGGLCVPASCTDDSQCAAPSLCASAFRFSAACIPKGATGNTYVCQKPADGCQMMKDCNGEGPTPGRHAVCGFDPLGGRRACGAESFICP